MSYLAILGEKGFDLVRGCKGESVICCLLKRLWPGSRFLISKKCAWLLDFLRVKDWIEATCCWFLQFRGYLDQLISSQTGLIQFWSQSQMLLHGTYMYKWLPLGIVYGELLASFPGSAQLFVTCSVEKHEVVSCPVGYNLWKIHLLTLRLILCQSNVIIALIPHDHEVYTYTITKPARTVSSVAEASNVHTFWQLHPHLFDLQHGTCTGYIFCWITVTSTTQPHLVAKIYSRTDIFSDRRLQRSWCGNNNARSSEQQDMHALG